MHCLTCHTEIVRNQHYAESEEAFLAREASGYCRRKCAREAAAKPSHPRSRPTLFLTQQPVYEVEARGPQWKEAAVVDEAYRRFLRSLPCLIPGCCNPSIFHHQNERHHGKQGGKTTDYRGLNICEFHHTLGGTDQLEGSYHGMGKLTGWRFWKFYGIDVEATIHRLNQMWLDSGHKFKEG